jgi:hypothetical protein
MIVLTHDVDFLVELNPLILVAVGHDMIDLSPDYSHDFCGHGFPVRLHGCQGLLELEVLFLREGTVDVGSLYVCKVVGDVERADEHPVWILFFIDPVKFGESCRYWMKLSALQSVSVLASVVMDHEQGPDVCLERVIFIEGGVMEQCPYFIPCLYTLWAFCDCVIPDCGL